MKIPENVRVIIKNLLKNDLITVKELAMLNENKKEDREAIIEIIQRIYQKRESPIYQKREAQFGTVEVVHVSEDDILDLLDYITDEPVKETITIPQSQGIEFVPYNYPYKPYPGDGVVYCNKTA